MLFNILKGTSHTRAVVIDSSLGNTGQFKGNNFTKGSDDTTTYYNGFTLFSVDDIFGGSVYIYPSVPTKFRTASTEQRNDPNYTKVGGEMVFDITLNKPIWWDGVQWVDAVNNIV